MNRHDPDEAVERVRAANDIVATVGSYIRLRKAGRNFKGLCPFHTEKTPSFIVTPDRQTFHCFGCARGGDVFRFVMDMDGVRFPEALRTLAARAGITLKGTWKRKESGEKERQFRVLDFASRLFRREIESPGGKEAAAYLKSRGITDETSELFQIGMAPDSWRWLREEASRKEITDQELFDTGLLISKEKGNPYDRFRNRLIFPICDSSGRTTGFGGRVLDNSEPKYLNSPETALFKKGESLYGLHHTRGDIHRSGCAILVEGYTDLISLYQAGIRNVVAPLGTALTQQQSRLISYYTDRVVLLFDGDDAGMKAALRSLAVLYGEGLSASVAVLPDGCDPDQLLREKGTEAMLETIKAAESLVPFIFGFPFAGGKEEAVRVTIPVLAAVKDEIRLGLLLKELHDRTGLAEEVLFREVRAARSDDREVKALSVKRAPSATKRLIEAQRGIAYLGFEHPDLLPVIRRVVRTDEMQDLPARKLLKALYKFEESGEEPTQSLLTFSGVDREFSRLRVESGDVEDPLSMLQDYIVCVREDEIERKSRQLQEELRDAEERNDLKGCSRILAERSRLAEQRRNLAHATKGDSTGAKATGGERSNSPR